MTAKLLADLKKYLLFYTTYLDRRGMLCYCVDTNPMYLAVGASYDW